MKKTILKILPVTILFFIGACNNSKKVTDVGKAGGSEMLYVYKWNLTALQGTAVNTASLKIKPHLLFTPGQVSTVAGSTGCNKLKGSFELTSENSIKLSPIATTRMACPDNDSIETDFMQALNSASKWSIKGNELLLLNNNILVATFTGEKVNN